jgi:hypothetical protein
MKTPLCLLILSMCWCTFCFGQTAEKHLPVLPTGKLSVAEARSSDSTRMDKTIPVAVFKVSPAAQQSKDTLKQEAAGFAAKAFTRMPFFIDEQFSVALSRAHSAFGYENVISFGTTFLWNPAKKLTIGVTPVISHYFWGPGQNASSLTDFSCEFAARYSLTDRLSLNAYGQVSTTPVKPYCYPLPAAPQNVFGAGVMFKVSKSVGIGLSIEKSDYNGFGSLQPGNRFGLENMY